MIKKDPNKQVLEAYYNALNDQVVYNGEVVPCGTRLSREDSLYIYFYIENIEDYLITTDTVMYEVTVGIEIVNYQDINEGDDRAVNDVIDQVQGIVMNDDALLMTNFTCPMVTYGDMDQSVSQTESNNVLVKKLRIINYIEQL